MRRYTVSRWPDSELEGPDTTGPAAVPPAAAGHQTRVGRSHLPRARRSGFERLGRRAGHGVPLQSDRVLGAGHDAQTAGTALRGSRRARRPAVVGPGFHAAHEAECLVLRIGKLSELEDGVGAHDHALLLAFATTRVDERDPLPGKRPTLLPRAVRIRGGASGLRGIPRGSQNHGVVSFGRNVHGHQVLPQPPHLYVMPLGARKTPPLLPAASRGTLPPTGRRRMRPPTRTTAGVSRLTRDVCATSSR
jgi:hypothetical protein